MNSHLTLLALAALTAPAAANPSTRDRGKDPGLKYYEYRTTITEPPFGLAKVKALLKDQFSGWPQPAKVEGYDKLSLEEKFTFNMIRADDASQGCFMMPIPSNGGLNEISAYPVSGFNNQTFWSKSQIDFLHDHRAHVVDLIRTTIKLRKRVGANLKQAILEVNGVELIPDLTQTFSQDRRDLDILSVLTVLMNKNGFGPFTASHEGKTLYGPNSNHQSFIRATDANQKATIAMASDFYKSWKK